MGFQWATRLSQKATQTLLGKHFEKRTLALYLRHLVQALATRFRGCGDERGKSASISAFGRFDMCDGYALIDELFSAAGQVLSQRRYSSSACKAEMGRWMRRCASVSQNRRRLLNGASSPIFTGHRHFLTARLPRCPTSNDDSVGSFPEIQASFHKKNWHLNKSQDQFYADKLAPNPFAMSYERSQAGA